MWLKTHKLDFSIITSHNITKELILQALRVSENGFDDILIPVEKMSSTKKEIYEFFCDESMSVSTLLSVLRYTPMLLKSPIMFDDKHLMTGFDEYEIRKFLPRTYRERSRFR
ncbi:ArsC/Spx/MgsR family protein [Lactococcus garvieae]|uniref:ArsC/Spx/MgsR family protein n=1 Tax=Lactococcus garvieae TaxID=1363 RepID=UPI00138E3E1A|nr:ArsC/Spx/MgsR family protein [Lactococcus garvieae]MDG6192387.1 transcriptional regulator [Lactococcus garvieae]QPR48049.1 transcriptional regulator [Lactococcus garvieae]QPR49291.1 transcriptional regulator [Lactococcus garvieae]